MTAQEFPPFYDDLDATREHALAQISRGVKDRRSAMHTLTIATLGEDGRARMRTVVNRGYDAQTRALRFNTDARSSKLHELRTDPRAGVHIYDAKAKIQLRLDTVATIHTDGDLHAKAWENTREFSRECYRVVPAPGDSLLAPMDLKFNASEDGEKGIENFTAVTLAITSMEWLYLAHQGHRRARFTWNDAGALTQTWLVP